MADKKTTKKKLNKDTEKTLTQPSVQKTEPKKVKTYKGICIFLIIFLYIEFFALLFIQCKYYVSFEPKNVHSPYSIQERVLTPQQRLKLQRERHKAYQNTHTQKQHVKPHHRSGKRVQERSLSQHQKMKIQKRDHKQHKRYAAPQNMQKPIKKPTPVKPKIEKPVVKCPEPVARKAQYVEAQYAPYAQPGKAKIQGKACFELNDGSQKCIPGLDVYINPVTDYSNEWYERGWAGTEYLEVADARVIPFNKTVKTDAKGNFTFDNLAPGSYYVVTQLCLPTAQDAKTCEYRRYASKVTMKNLVRPTLKQIFPKKN